MLRIYNKNYLLPILFILMSLVMEPMQLICKRNTNIRGNIKQKVVLRETKLEAYKMHF